jgi:hypothetical protein
MLLVQSYVPAFGVITSRDVKTIKVFEICEGRSRYVNEATAILVVQKSSNEGRYSEFNDKRRCQNKYLSIADLQKGLLEV